jgi:hypothetical protein
MNRLKLPLPVPARSDLYSPEPREHDWGMLEGLASYLARLAEYHAVSVHNLLTYLVAEAPFDMPFTEGVIRKSAGNRSYELNGMDSIAERWSTLVANQTLRKGIEQMTLLPWRHLVASYQLLHTRQHWCPQCLDRWWMAGQPLYWPLLWSLQTVTVCSIDRVPLDAQCHHCDAAVQPGAARARIGFCPNCKVWLGFEGRPRSNSRSATGATYVTNEAIKLAEATRAMLAASPLIQEDLSIQKLLALLDHGVKVSGCTQGALAQRLGTHRRLGYRLTHNKRVTLAILLQLLTSMELEMADFVREPIAILVSHHLDSFVRSLPRKQTGNLPAARKVGQRAPTDIWDGAQALLEATVAEEYPPSVRALARRMRVSSSALRYHYPELCRTISEKRRLRSRGEVVRRVLTEAANAEVPPPPLYRLASQVKTGAWSLHEHFPDEVAAVQARRARWEAVNVQQKLEGFLEIDPPLSMREVAHRIGWCTTYVKGHHPQLYQAIVRRYAEYRHTCALEREQQAQAAVRDAVLQLHSSGHFPTKANVARILRASDWTILTETEREAFDEMMAELGLR